MKSSTSELGLTLFWFAIVNEYKLEYVSSWKDAKFGQWCGKKNSISIF